jgi:hypothetical protein
MRFYICFFFSLSIFQLNAQITFVEKVKKDSLFRNQAYVFLNRTNSFRLLTPNDDFIAGELGEKKFEKALNTYSFGLGLKGYLSRFFLWDAGMMYLQNGEQYEYKSIISDTSFSYQNYYKYISMPLKLNFTFGNKVRFFGGIGLIPQLFLNYRQYQQWETTLGNRESNKINTKDGFNSFTTSIVYNAGISLHSKKSYGIFVSADYRNQIQNGYNKTSYFKHKSYGAGFTVGLIKEL